MRKMKKVVAAVLILTMAMALLTGCKKKVEIDGVVDIFDYVTVTYDGSNGEGTALVNIDYDGMETEMVGGEDKVKDLDSVDDLGTLTKYINVVAGMTFHIDKNTDLSNGDVVTVSVEYDAESAETAGVVFGDELSRQYTVKGLK